MAELSRDLRGIALHLPPDLGLFRCGRSLLECDRRSQRGHIHPRLLGYYGGHRPRAPL